MKNTKTNKPLQLKSEKCNMEGYVDGCVTFLSHKKNGLPLFEACQKGRNKTIEKHADYIVNAVNSFPSMLDALKATRLFLVEKGVDHKSKAIFTMVDRAITDTECKNQ